MGKFTHMTEKSPARVLVVDDEALIRWSLSESLADAGFEVTEAADRASALRAVSAARGEFDVVLLDFRLPDSNDLGLLGSVRQLAPKAGVIMMTAYSTPEMVQGAEALGAYRVIGKPFEVPEVVSLVRAASGRE
jgi:two-component system, NtrC family, response regulator AtoC